MRTAADASVHAPRRPQVPNNAEALNELSTLEKQALERAFQTTLSKWYAATVNWMDGCQARRAQGSPPAPLTKSAANTLCCLHWDGFSYAKEPRKADKRDNNALTPAPAPPARAASARCARPRVHTMRPLSMRRSVPCLRLLPAAALASAPRGVFFLSSPCGSRARKVSTS